jgi:Tol biopolymer transport system component/DNA-binding winged helix-turn-helix (wHTH) protein
MVPPRMSRPSGFPAPFRLGPWLVQADLNRITGPGGAYQIEPRVMRVLLALAERPGGVVTRQELLDGVWADAIVGEEILTRAVSELRRVFSDDARHPAYIETIRQHGYRLIMPVVPDAAAEPVAPPPVEAAAPSPAAAAPSLSPLPAAPAVPAVSRDVPRRSAPPARRLLPLLALLAAAALLITAPRWWSRWRTAETATPAPAPLTSYPGRELHPALSPDGTRVAFAWSGPDGRSPGIYVKQRNSETALRLTAEPGWPAWPAWLPDGQSLAFVQSTDTTSAICVVPSLGGAVRRLREVPSLVEGLTVAPDGQRLAWAAREDSGAWRVAGLAFSEPAATWRPVPATGPAGDVQPRLSPDGRWLAWVALGPGGDGTVECLPVTGGAARVVARACGPVRGLAWTPDSRQLVFAAAPAGSYGLWLAGRDGGDEAGRGRRAAPVALAADFAWNPTIATATGDLAYEQVRLDQDLWRLRVAARDPWRFETAPYLVSTRWESDPDLDAGSGRVAFVSTRSGSPQVWVAGPEGDGPSPLTDLAGVAVSQPRWAPDGSRLAFRAVAAAGAVVMVVPAAGGRPRAVPLTAADVLLAGWTPDGRALLVAADLGDGWQIHRLDPVSGGRQALTRAGGLTAAETPDGDRLYHTRPGLAGLWRLDLAGGGEPQLEIPGLAAGDRDLWRLTKTGILWVLRARGRAVLVHHDPATGLSQPVAELPGLAVGGLAASPEGDQVLFAHAGEADGDLMVMEHFASSHH